MKVRVGQVWRFNGAYKGDTRVGLHVAVTGFAERDSNRFTTGHHDAAIYVDGDDEIIDVQRPYWTLVSDAPNYTTEPTTPDPDYIVIGQTLSCRICGRPKDLPHCSWCKHALTESPTHHAVQTLDIRSERIEWLEAENKKLQAKVNELMRFNSELADSAGDNQRAFLIAENDIKRLEAQLKVIEAALGPTRFRKILSGRK